MPIQNPRYRIDIQDVRSVAAPHTIYEAEGCKVDNGVLVLTGVVPQNSNPDEPFAWVILPIVSPIHIDDRWPVR